MQIEYPCTSCGICCQNIAHIQELKKYDRGDGQCKYLKENKCSIYDIRPLICRVDAMYDSYYKHQISAEEFIAMNLEACKNLQMTHNVPLQLHVTSNLSKERSNSSG